MTGWLDKVDASMYTVVHQFQPVDTIFLLKIGVEASFDVVDYGLPATSDSQLLTDGVLVPDLSSLLTKSPNPGVSTTVNFRRTPFSSISNQFVSSETTSEHADAFQTHQR